MTSATWCLVIPFLFILSIKSSYSQQIINLSAFGGGKSTQINATGAYALYVSAYSDLKELLSQLFIQTPNDPLISLYQLKFRKMHPSSGFLQPFRVLHKQKASLVSNLTDAQMKTLRGFLYITTAKQMNSNSFYVFDVNQTETVSFDNTKPDNCTIVFLNSNFSYTQPSSSIISGWIQNDNKSSVSIYHGVPTSSDELRSSEIFSNPVSTTEKYKFMYNVEKFSLSLPVFYLKTHRGVQFNISAGYYDVNGTQTTSQSTTGFYMKPMNSPDRNITIDVLTVNTLVVDTSKKLTGANAIGTMPKNSTISINSVGVDGQLNGYSTTPVSQILGWSTPIMGKRILISSKNGYAGQFFVQFYTLSYN